MPPRKFAPTPIEQTTKSSRQPAKEDTPKPPRRFAPDPVEQSVKSSKDARPPPPQDNEVKPKPRRFAPEPVETTTKSSKDLKQQESDKPKPRRFAPQVVEESHKTSKDVKKEPEKRPHVKFTPEPVATTYGGNRKNNRSDESMSDAASNADEQEKTPPRKFTPILLDTATRSRRAGNPNAILSQSDRTEYGYHAHEHHHWRRINGVITPSKGSDIDMQEEQSDSDETASSTIEHSSELRRQVSPLDGSAGARPSCLLPARQHSFRMPELDTIESSESEPDSSPSSLSDSPSIAGSPLTAPDSSFDFYKHATRRRESIDESFTHYLLDVERKKAQQRLEEQALAAFPNADFGYEPPRHYFNDDDDSDEMEIEDRPVTFDFEDDVADMARRESTAKMDWEQQELQRSAEQAQQERNAAKSTAKKTSQSPWWHQPNSMLATADVDQELKSMRDRARPPMLGKDLVFPRCPSPEPARFDVTQGSTALRAQMCYLEEVASAEKKRSGEDGRLWQAKQPENKRISSVKSPQSTQSPKSPTAAKGLWGGFCINDGETNTTTLVPPSGPTGLMTPKIQTPRVEAANPFEANGTASRPGGLMTPGTPSGLKQADLANINAVLVTESQIDVMMETEYPDAFITQVYNYLSLGYPSLAKPFDEELSKISRIPISELRQDDRKAKATPRGYIRLGPDFEGGGGEGLTEDGCMRWQALKKYVREWAKQEKNMVKTDGVGGNWGTGARRGSWAI